MLCSGTQHQQGVVHLANMVLIVHGYGLLVLSRRILFPDAMMLQTVYYFVFVSDHFINIYFGLNYFYYKEYAMIFQKLMTMRDMDHIYEER